MPYYLVTATPKTNLLDELEKRLAQDEFVGMQPFGRALTKSLRDARIRKDGEAVWEEEDYCRPLLAEERAAVLDSYFDNLKVEVVREGRGFTSATIAALASGAGVLSIMSLIPVVLERAMGVGPALGATVLLAWSATSAVTAIGARWIPAAPRSLLIGGLLGCAEGQFAVCGLHADSSLARVLPGMFVAGAANGILNAALGRQAVATVPADRVAMGSGANNTARYLGSGTGLTICALLITHAGPEGGTRGWNLAVLVSVLFSVLGAIAVYLVEDRAAHHPPSISERR